MNSNIYKINPYMITQLIEDIKYLPNFKNFNIKKYLLDEWVEIQIKQIEVYDYETDEYIPEYHVLYNWYDLTETNISEEDLELITDEEIEEIGKLAKFTMYVWWTWTWKTYKAITETKDNFTIAVPTRQLAYEIIIDYNEIDWVSTGEINLQWKNNVVTYEELQFNNYFRETLIIDEAHFLQDRDRGANLLRFIADSIKSWITKKVILLTATDSISDKLKEQLDIQTEKLKPFKQVEKIEIKDEDEFASIASQGTTLVFTKYKPEYNDAYYYAKMFDIDDMNKVWLIHADIPTSERIETQIRFKRGELKLVISSNVLAQWVNFPADNVLIEYNEWDSAELIQQKIWRAWRPQYSDKAYYYCRYVPPIYKKKKNKTKTIRRTFFYKWIFIWHLDFEEFEIPDIYNPNYSWFKYSKRFLNYLKDNDLIDFEDLDKLDFLEKEERKLFEIIQKEKKK